MRKMSLIVNLLPSVDLSNELLGKLESLNAEIGKQIRNDFWETTEKIWMTLFYSTMGPNFGPQKFLIKTSRVKLQFLSYLDCSNIQRWSISKRKKVNQSCIAKQIHHVILNSFKYFTRPKFGHPYLSAVNCFITRHFNMVAVKKSMKS